jgi:murein L,D-transpeptidase YcbB/YkuD
LWTKEKIKAAMNASREQHVTLKQTVPVFIAYFTAFVDRQGRLNFRDDVYQRDSRLAQMIFEKSNTSGQ